MGNGKATEEKESPQSMHTLSEVHVCPWCGLFFEPRRIDQRFCFKTKKKNCREEYYDEARIIGVDVLEGRLKRGIYGTDKERST